MATQYVTGEGGDKFIAASQRPDGTWRQPKRVKEGFVPQEEVPLYESKAKKVGKGPSSGLPPGITPEVWESMKQQQRAMAKNKIQADIDAITVTQSSASAPLSNHSNKGDEWVTVMNKKKKKQQSMKGDEEINSKMNGLSVNNNNNVTKTAKPKKKKKKQPAAAANVAAVSSDVEEEENVQIKNVSNTASVGGKNDASFDPAKRLRNLRKKLKEIEELKLKDPKTLAPEQLDKIKRIHEVKSMINQLSNQVE